VSRGASPYDGGEASMTRILLLHASFDGQTARIAERIGAGCAAAGHHVTVRAVDSAGATFDIATHDAVILGGAVRYGRFGRALESLARANATLLDGLPNALFCVCLTAARPEGAKQAAQYVAAFERRTGWTPQSSAIFAGALPYRRYNPLLRLVMRLVSGSAGGDTDTSRNHEYTDWAAVDRFAAQFAAGLPFARTALAA
jgi:menaquinone-dependent protoporphyrinogen oxidase